MRKGKIYELARDVSMPIADITSDRHGTQTNSDVSVGFDEMAPIIKHDIPRGRDIRILVDEIRKQFLCEVAAPCPTFPTCQR